MPTLSAGGAISGRVTDSSSDGLSNVTVDVDSTGSGGYVATATTDTNGDYTVTGLPAGTQTVCFDASQATGGSSTGGYLDQCYHGVSWNGYENEVVAGATPVTVAASATTSAINATLVSSGAITGTVTDSTSDPLSDVDVEVTTSGGQFFGSSYTGSDGTYTISGLASGTYDVCFLATYTSGGSSTSGYVDQCYNDVSWDGSLSDISGATGVTVTAGSTRSGVNAALAAAPTAAISGTVTDSTSDPLTDVEVEAFTGDGSNLKYGYTGSDGSYTISGLTTGTYDVCFSGEYASGGASTTGYESECYKNVAWNGDPYEASGATGVQVTAGSTTSAINVSLNSAGAVSGTVVDSGSNPLDGVPVEVLSSSGTSVGYSDTGADGTYSVAGLPAGTYDVCFSVSAYNVPTGGTSTTGYLAQCYNDVSWNGNTSDLAGATAVQVSAGSTTSDINATLASAGAVTGTVDDTGSNAVERRGGGGVQHRQPERRDRIRLGLHPAEWHVLGRRTPIRHL